MNIDTLRRALGALLLLAPAALGQVPSIGAPAVPANLPVLEWRAVTWLDHHRNHAMAYDPVRERTVLFGGASFNTPANLTWEWDGRAWHKRFPRDRPTGRLGHSLAFDPVRKTVLLFGGYTLAHETINDTWEWDGNDWRQLNPANSPSLRFDHQMATDPIRGQIVLFGGFAGSTQLPLSDTWIWDGSNWNERFPKTAVVARGTHQMCFNPRTGRVVLFGGYNVWPTFAGDDTYEWDGGDWLRFTPKTRPPSMAHHTLAYDPNLNEVLLNHGGVRPANSWSWDGLRWKSIVTRTWPPVHSDRGYKIATDLARKQVVMFGYGDYKDPQHGAQTWTFDGQDWKLLDKWGGSHPDLFRSMSGGWTAVHDSARDEFVIVGVPPARGEMQTWVMRNDRYVKMTPPKAPPFRIPHTVCYHAGMQRTVMFGGEKDDSKGGYLTDTWTWDGTSWIEHPTSNKGPWPGRMFGPAVYDSRRNKIVFFYVGGGARLETWEWDEAAGWAQRFPRNQPSYRGAMVYDPGRGRTVLVKNLTLGYQAELWEWDGTNWQQVPVTLPYGRSWVLGYSHELGGVVAFAGWSTAEDEAWLWNGTAWAKLPHGAGSIMVSSDYGYWQATYDVNRQRLRAFNFDHRTSVYAHDLGRHHLLPVRPYPRPGQSAVLDVRYPGQSQLFWFAMSTGDWPGIPLRHIPYVGNQVLPLQAGTLLDLSMKAGIFVQLDQQGYGQISIPIPALPSLVGFRFYGAGILLGANQAIDAISNAVEMEVIR